MSKRNIEALKLWYSKKIKRIVLAILSLAFGISAMLVSNHILNQKIAAIENNQTAELKTSVIVAKQEILPGTLLDENNLAVRDIPEQWIPSYAIKANHFSKIENQRSAYAFHPGDIVISASLYSNASTPIEPEKEILLSQNNHSRPLEKNSATSKVVILYGNHPTAKE